MAENREGRDLIKDLRDSFPAPESYEWIEKLNETMYEIEEWLDDPLNKVRALEVVESLLREKHHDYGEDNLKVFGELGILVRVSDKVARLKNLVEQDALITAESRADTWMDLAGYAIQALIMLKMAGMTDPKELYERRKGRLIRGFCPDCGEGVLLRENFFDNHVHCSRQCGFATGDLYSLHLSYPDFNEMVDFLAREPAYGVQK